MAPRNQSRTIFASVLFYALQTFQSPVVGQESGVAEARELLLQVKQAREGLRRLATHTVLRARTYLDDSAEPKSESITLLDYRRRDDRHDLMRKVYSAKTDPPTFLREYHSIVGEDGRTWSQRAYPDGMGVYVSSDPRYRLSEFIHISGSQIHGVFRGDVLPFHDLLLELSDDPESSFEIRRESLGDAECVVIDARTAHGHHTVWIDPEAGFIVRKARVIKEPGDYAGDYLLNEDPWEPRPRARREFTLDEIEIRKVGAHFVAVGGKSVSKTTYQDGTTKRVENEVTVEEISTDPDFAALGAFEMDIAEGTAVTFDSAPGMKFEWHGGQAVPVIDPDVINAIQENISAVIATAKRREEAPSPVNETAARVGGEQQAPMASAPARRGSVVFLLIGAAVIGTLALLFAARSARGS